MDKFQAEGPRIREMSAADLPLMPDFLYHAIYLPLGAQRPPLEIIHKPEISIYIDGYGKPGDVGAAAEMGGKAIGMAWARLIRAYGHLDDKTPELAISVLPDYRGKGIGAALMQALFGLLAKAAHRRVSLSVNKENPAVRFYLRLGFAVVCENEEDFIMLKELANTRCKARDQTGAAAGRIHHCQLSVCANEASKPRDAGFCKRP